MAENDPGEKSTEPAESERADESGSLLNPLWIVCAIGLAIGAIMFAPKPNVPKKAPYVPPPEKVELPAALPPAPPPKPPLKPLLAIPKPNNQWSKNAFVRHWWSEVPNPVLAGTIDTGPRSNITSEDYAGSESCRECHARNYDDWSRHPHRWMNAVANDDAVKGDFSGTKSINYLGGTARFVTEDGHRKMKLKRGDRHSTYRVTRTIGSRFYQYYVGLMEHNDHTRLLARKERETTEHVLPFGYWIGNQEWVPTVHVFRDADQDEQEKDPFGQWGYVDYDHGCSECHTTWTFGDWMIKSVGAPRFAQFTPRRVESHLGELFKATHGERLPGSNDLTEYRHHEVEKFIGKQRLTEYPEERPSLGVTCESCHLGSAEHAKRSTKDKSDLLPAFFPVSPYLHSAAGSTSELTERTGVNMNFICAKCHSGDRPKFANGTHTWNSTEFADAAFGFCYDPTKAKSKGMDHLTCVNCHNPHKPIGQKWSNTAVQDDQSCIKCHQEYGTPEGQAAHTHHSPGSAGSHCMDCHMPKINEGLQEMVRTHRIQHPVVKEMVEENHPNACNLCHLDKSVNWTLNHMNDWYGGPAIARARFMENNPNPDAPAGPEWLKSSDGPTRLAAGEALAIANPRPHLSAFFDLLIVDGQLINRQFVQKQLKDSIGLDLKAMGYQFYMQKHERRAVIDRMRDDLIKRFGKSQVAEKKP